MRWVRRHQRLTALVVVAFGLLLAAAIVSGPFWQARRPRLPLGDGPDAAGREGTDSTSTFQLESLTGPAFTPDATVEDLADEARRAARRLSETFPGTPEPLHTRARLCQHFGNQNEAVLLWEQCIELSPVFLDAYSGLASAAYDRGDYETAIRWSRKGLAIDYGVETLQILLAESLLKLNRLQEIIVDLEPVLQTGSLAAETGIPFGQACLRSGQYENAQRAFEAVLAATPGSDRLRKQAHYGLATLYMTVRQPDKAKEHRRRFSELSKVDLSTTYERIRQGDELASVRRITVETHNDCARIYLRHGHRAEAEETWVKASALDPSDVESRTQLASAYESTGREQQALAMCEQLRDLQPKNADHWLNVGLLNARLDRFDEALAAVGQAVKLEPNNQKYRDVYETIRKNR